MTIFDSIKYPISEYPTAEELEALPDELYKKWIGTSSWNDTEAVNNREWVALWMSSHLQDPEIFPGRGTSPKDMEEILQDLKLLRKMIMEYEG
jgi:hypothetical protein